MADRAVELLGKHLSVVEARMKRLRTIQSYMAEDPEIATILADLLLRAEANGEIEPTRVGEPPRDSQNFSTIIAFFRENNNDWRSVSQIVEATGLKRHEVNYVLLDINPDRFESKFESPKRKFFRPKQQEAAVKPTPTLSRPKIPAPEKTSTKEETPASEEMDRPRIVRPKHQPDAAYMLLAPNGS